MNNFEILRENKNKKGKVKSIFLKDENGVKFWVMAKMMRADGSLTKGGLASRDEQIANPYVAPVKPTTYALPVSDWESEKCVGIDRQAELHGQFIRIRLFFAKSMIKNGEVPFWLWTKKSEEALDAKAINGSYPWYV